MSGRGCRAGDGAELRPQEAECPQHSGGLGVTAPPPRCLLGPCSVPSSVLRAGAMGEQTVRGAGPVTGPALPSRKQSSDVVEDPGVLVRGVTGRASYTCPQVAGLTWEPVTTAGHKLIDEPIIKSSNRQERSEALGVRTVVPSGARGLGVVSGRVLGAWGRFPAVKCRCCLTWWLRRVALCGESSSYVQFL